MQTEDPVHKEAFRLDGNRALGAEVGRPDLYATPRGQMIADTIRQTVDMILSGAAIKGDRLGIDVATACRDLRVEVTTVRTRAAALPALYAAALDRRLMAARRCA